jgi:hypothetical protein
VEFPQHPHCGARGLSTVHCLLNKRVEEPRGAEEERVSGEGSDSPCHFIHAPSLQSTPQCVLHSLCPDQKVLFFNFEA